MNNDYVKQMLQFMKEHDLNQKQFAEKAGVSNTKMSNIINNRVTPTKETLDSISQNTGIVFREWDEPLKLMSVQEAAHRLNMNPEHLKLCLKNKAFDYQFGIHTDGYDRYIIWRDKLERFIAM